MHVDFREYLTLHNFSWLASSLNVCKAVKVGVIDCHL